MTSRVDVNSLHTILNCAATVDLSVYMQSANVIVDDLLGTSTLSTGVLALIEMYIAAHLYTLTQERGALASETTGDATERYHNIYKAGYSSTRFGQQAVILDTTGALARESAKAEKSAVKSAEFRLV